MTPYRSAGRSRWPRAAIDLEEHRGALTLEFLDRLLGDLLLTGHREIVVALPAGPIDNAALVVLCMSARRAIARGAELRIVGADPRVRETLELCRLDGLEFFSSIRGALARPRPALVQLLWLRSRATVERARADLNRSNQRHPST